MNEPATIYKDTLCLNSIGQYRGFVHHPRIHREDTENTFLTGSLTEAYRLYIEVQNRQD